ncbi:SDR family oxidoreductase, partial [Aeromonas dhakensis]
MAFHQHTLSLVIGGHTGIGRAVADALRQRPGQVIVASRKSGLDITDQTSIDNLLTNLGQLDHLVITAGSQAPGGSLLELDLTAAKAAFDTKFWGTLAVIRSLAPYMAPGGTITLTTGFLARKTVPGTLVKTTMNAALEAAARLLARELAPIRVNVVSPGLTDTEAYAAMAPEAREAMLG